MTMADSQQKAKKKNTASTATNNSSSTSTYKNSSPTLWSDLPRRLTTICIGLPIAVSIMSNTTMTLLAAQVIHLIASIEWVRLLNIDSTTKYMTSLPMVLFPLVSLAIANLQDQELFHIGMALGGSLLYLASFTQDDNTIGYHVIHGLIFISIPFQTLNYMASQSFGHSLTLLLTVWNCDSGALIAGRLSKMFFPNNTRTKITTSTTKYNDMPSWRKWLFTVSPAKSIAGMWGGLVGGTGTALIAPLCWNWVYNHFGDSLPLRNHDFQSQEPQMTIPFWNSYPYVTFSDRFQLGLLLSILAIVGDLTESAIKRKHGRKDSSSIFPGHGGILDRFDSAFLSVLVYRYIVMSSWS